MIEDMGRRVITSIGISGPIGSGKTTLSAAVIDELGRRGQGAVIVPFAKSLKRKMANLVKELADKEGIRFGSQEIEYEKRTLYGAGLQWLGEWYRQKVDERYWVTLWCAEAAVEICKGNVVIADDVRYPNEALAIKNLSGVTLRIDCAPHVDDDQRDISHSSELALADYEFDFRVPEMDREEYALWAKGFIAGCVAQ